MPIHQTRISAFIARSTKDLLEQYAEEHGVKKAKLVEEALLHHLLALRELPADVIIPPHIVVARDRGEEILKRIDKPRRPTKAMRELFKT